MERKPIRRGDIVRFLPQWQDKGDDQIVYIATDDEDKGRVTVKAMLGMSINPTQVVSVDMIDFGAALPDKETLASEFTIVVREWLTPAQCREIDRRNAESRLAGDFGVCHSHDFCDANQAMLDALARFNVEPDLQDDRQASLITDAWNIAKEHGFGTEE